MKTLQPLAFIGIAAAVLTWCAPASSLQAQTSFAEYRQSSFCVSAGQKVYPKGLLSPEAIGNMLALANVTKADYVIDLTYGDSTLARSAAIAGAQVTVYPVCEEGVNESRAQLARMTDRSAAERVMVSDDDILAADLHFATVVTMTLVPRFLEQMAPKLRRELRPGARIVSFLFDFERWKADREIFVGPPGKQQRISLWTIPAAGK